MQVEDNLEQRIVEELTCTVCWFYMSPPIPKCAAGHSFCNQCFDQLHCCPRCFSPKGSGKNFAMERLYSKVKFPCRYQGYGCDYANKAVKIPFHEKFCDFSPRPCPLKFNTLCSWMGNLRSLEGHCEEFHPHSFFKGDKNTFKTDFGNMYDNMIFFIILAHDSFFRFTGHIHNTGMSHVSVNYLGQQFRSEKFSYKLAILKGEDETVSDIFEKCCSHQPDVTKPFVGTSDVSIAFNMLKNACNDDGDLTFTIEVSSNPEEEVAVAKPATEDLETNESLEMNVLAELECAVCLNYMTPPIMQCESGHNFCATCYNIMEHCPKCEAPKAASRNFSLERVFDWVKLK
ncbi:hypothetical protein JTB14_014897 [Gonioctena quinquepunctata]|nr:hypothetical protein JTB14_014897 [Gonioctena quinquepunctata]